MTVAPASTDIPSFEILLNGETLSEEYQVLSISVSTEINRIPKATISISDGDVAQSDFRLSSSQLVIPGTEIEIKAGYHSINETIFKGRIVNQRVRVKRTNQSLLIIEARSPLYKMTFNKKFRIFEESTDSDIAEEIFAEYDFSSEVESLSTQHLSMVQYNTTDWDFILSRIEANGHLLFPTLDGVKTGPPIMTGSTVHTMEYGNSVLEFDLEIDSRKSDKAHNSYGWDYADQQTLETEAEDPGSIEQGNITRSTLDLIDGTDKSVNQGMNNEAELQTWSNAKLTRSELSRIMGTISGPGASEIICGDLVEIKGINDRFNGNAFVGAIHHEIAGGTWLTDIQIGIDSEYFLKSKNSHEKVNEFLPGINNLFSGVTMALEGDPDGEDRIQVHLPGLHEDGTGIWARQATLDAGDSRGSSFRPEIDDEVIVGFVNGDPRFPIILGMLHSSAKPSPIPGADDNHEKGFITRGKMKLLFNDESNIMTLDTPNGNQIILSEDEGSVLIQDENGNSLTMNSDGITIDSAADINIKAAGDVNIEGINIKASASAELKAEGSASANLESGGITVVKGSLVQIN